MHLGRQQKEEGRETEPGRGLDTPGRQYAMARVRREGPGPRASCTSSIVMSVDVKYFFVLLPESMLNVNLGVAYAYICTEGTEVHCAVVLPCHDKVARERVVVTDGVFDAVGGLPSVLCTELAGLSHGMRAIDLVRWWQRRWEVLECPNNGRWERCREVICMGWVCEGKAIPTLVGSASPH